MDQAESGFRTRKAKVLVRHGNSHRVVAEVAITILFHHKRENCRRLRQFSLRYRRDLHSIHQPFRLPVSISIPHCGKILELLFTAIRDRSLISNPKVQATETESEQVRAPASVKAMDQASDREKRETGAAAPGSSGVVNRAAGLIATVVSNRLPDLKSNNARAFYSNRSRRTPKTRAGIRS